MAWTASVRLPLVRVKGKLMFCHVSFRFRPTLLVNPGCDHIACLRLMSSGDLVGALSMEAEVLR